MKNAAGDLVGSYTFTQLPLGAGGFVTQFELSADGSRMAHTTDVWNGYLRDAGDKAWRLLLRTDNLAEANYFPKPAGEAAGTDLGVAAIRIAPSNKNIIYALWNGRVFKSTDGAVTVTATTFGPKRLPSNGYSGGADVQRRFTRKIDVHPADPNTVIVGTWNDGVWYTTDGGTTWAAVAGLPATTNTISGTPGVYLVGFDPGQPTNVYIHAFGSGLYRSTTGVAGSFTLIAGGPAAVSCLVVSPAGTVYMCEFRTSGAAVTDALKKLVRGGSTFTAIASSTNADQVAVNPVNELHLVWVDENGGSFVQTRDGGATVTTHGRIRGSGEIAWMSNRSKITYPAHLLFHPDGSKVWMADGIGVTWATPPTVNAETWVLHDFSAGNEELVPTYALSSPGNPPIVMTMDKPFWRIDYLHDYFNMWNYPRPVGGGLDQNIVVAGRHADYAGTDPAFIVPVIEGIEGYSTDAGKSLVRFTGATGLSGGCVAVSTPLNIVRVGANNQAAKYTLDGGAVWNNVTFGGYNPVNNLISALYVSRECVAADKARPGVFAMLVNNKQVGVTPDTPGRDIAGVWRTLDGGVTWVRQFAGCIQTSAAPGNGSSMQFWQCRFKYVPGYSGELLYADCDGNAANRLWWSADDGVTWTDIRASVRGLTGFGFGKPLVAGGRPAVFFIGKVAGIAGVYVSYDWFATEPVLIAARPMGHIGGFADITGDINVLGRCIVAMAVRGFALGEYGKSLSLPAA